MTGQVQPFPPGFRTRRIATNGTTLSALISRQRRWGARRHPGVPAGPGLRPAGSLGLVVARLRPDVLRLWAALLRRACRVVLGALPFGSLGAGVLRAFVRLVGLAR